MGIADNQKLEQQDAKRAKRSKAAEKEKRRLSIPPEEWMRWIDADAHHILELIHEATEAGGAIMFVRRADKSALGIRTYGDEVVTETYWAGDHENLIEKTDAVIGLYKDA